MNASSEFKKTVFVLSVIAAAVFGYLAWRQSPTFHYAILNRAVQIKWKYEIKTDYEAATYLDGKRILFLMTREVTGRNLFQWSGTSDHSLEKKTYLCLMDSDGKNKRILMEAPGWWGPIWNKEKMAIVRIVREEKEKSGIGTTDRTVYKEIRQINFGDWSTQKILGWQEKVINYKSIDVIYRLLCWSENGEELYFLVLTDDAKGRAHETVWSVNIKTGISRSLGIKSENIPGWDYKKYLNQFDVGPTALKYFPYPEQQAMLCVIKRKPLYRNGLMLFIKPPWWRA
jgi:hypothetical protein